MEPVASVNDLYHRLPAAALAGYELPSSTSKNFAKLNNQHKLSSLFDHITGGKQSESLAEAIGGVAGRQAIAAAYISITNHIITAGVRRSASKRITWIVPGAGIHKGETIKRRYKHHIVLLAKRKLP